MNDNLFQADEGGRFGFGEVSQDGKRMILSYLILSLFHILPNVHEIRYLRRHEL